MSIKNMLKRTIALITACSVFITGMISVKAENDTLVKFIESPYYTEITGNQATEMFNNGDSFFLVYYSHLCYYSQQFQKLAPVILDETKVNLYGVNGAEGNNLAFMWNYLNNTLSVTYPVLMYIENNEIILLQNNAYIRSDIIDILNKKVPESEKYYTEPHNRTKNEIIQKYKELSFDFSKKDWLEYDVTPSITAPYSSGSVKDEYLQDGLNALNLVRYIAGLSDNVTLNQSYIQYSQYAAVLNAANNMLNHHPSKPGDMDDNFYNTAYTGTSSSNLGRGYYNIAESIIRGYMDDSDKSNISRVGHRRWVLNPRMKETGFGFAPNQFTATYVFDNQNKDNFDYVCWPAKVMPYEMYINNGEVFSVSLGGNYKTPELNSVNVKITSMLKNQSWDINYIHNNPDDVYFNIDTGGYGSGACIIFKPNIIFDNNDIITIEVTGLEYQDGQSASLTYTVELFSAVSYTVNFYNDDTLYDTQNVEYYGYISTPSEPVKDGYIFKGWKRKDGIYIDAITEDTNFYAIWEKVSNNDEIGSGSNVGGNGGGGSDVGGNGGGSSNVGGNDGGGGSDVGGNGGGSSNVGGNDGGGGSDVGGNDVNLIKIHNIPSNKITLNKTKHSIGIKESYTLKATLKPNNSTDKITWSSSDKKIATVSQDGKVTGIKTGTVTITARTESGKTATCTITVKKAPSKVTLNKKELTVGKGETYTLKSALSSENAASKITWSSSDNKTVKVSSTGKITALKTGTATITAKTYNGKTSTCKVTVKKAPTGIKPKYTNLTLKNNKLYKSLPYTLSADSASNKVTFTSSNPAVAAVSSTGKIKTLSKGTTTVTIKTFNGKTCKINITVK